MKLSPAGLALIKRWEGLSLSAYRDVAGVWTIGYGHTKTAKAGQQITEAQAEALLREDVAWAEEAVNELVRVPLRQSAFDALVSFTFNLGRGALAQSTLLRILNEGDYDGAAEQFGRWIHAGGKVVQGLINRREAEATMFALPAPIERKDTVAPFIAAALPAILNAVPDLIKIFGDKNAPVAERNAKAAERVVDIAIQATGASNAQEAAERVAKDPVAAQAVRDAVRAEWFELQDAGGGIPAAREFAQKNPEFVPIMRNVSYVALSFLFIANAIVIGMVVAAAMGYTMPGWEQLLGIVIQADVGATTIALSFWLGSSLTKPRPEGSK